MTVQQEVATETLVKKGITIMPLSALDSKNSDIKELTIESRFGEVKVDKNKAIFFPQGLLGMPDNLDFCLTDIPKKDMGNFRLLQCLNDPSLSFVVLPLDMDNAFIERSDLEECCNVADIEAKNLLVMLIVSVQKTPDSTKVTANMRAPIIVDISDMAAFQHVFPHSKYEICQVL